MQDIVFREYDIRGIVGQELPIDSMYDLGKAIAYYFVIKKPTIKKIAIGMDGRLHSHAIKEHIVAAFIDSGIDVVFIGICPTPVLYFALQTCSVDGGIMITASHNPKEYNGLKLCLGKESLWGVQVKEIGFYYREKKSLLTRKKGVYTQLEVIPDYIAWLVEHFSNLVGVPISMVVDCGNGAAGTVLPQLIEQMKWQQVQLLYPEVDGNYPHHEADPVVEANMRDARQRVLSTPADFAVGFDGDCDRMAAMTKKGYLVPGDKLLALFAQQVLDIQSIATIVCDIKSSSSVIRVLQQWGAVVHLSPSGHAIIKKNMSKTKAIIGGELSCHFIFNDRYFGFDDGIYAFLRLCEMLHTTGKSLDEMLKIFPQTFISPELRIACPEDAKSHVIACAKQFFASKKNAEFITIDGMRVTMEYGWGLIRASNTQPVISIRFESDTQQGLFQLRNDFMHALEGVLDTTALENVQ